MNDRPAKARKFVTNFDGDEIDGKVYKLGAGVTGLDGPTGEYLVRQGRLSEVTDEHFETLGEGESANDQAGDEGGEEPDDADLEAAQKRFDDGDIDGDLLKEGTDELKTEADLRQIAEDEEVELKSSMTKAQIAVAIMAKRDS